MNSKNRLPKSEKGANFTMTLHLLSQLQNHHTFKRKTMEKDAWFYSGKSQFQQHYALYHIQNESRDETRKWKFMRKHCWVPPLVMLRPYNKMTLARSEPRPVLSGQLIVIIVWPPNPSASFIATASSNIMPIRTDSLSFVLYVCVL